MKRTKRFTLRRIALGLAVAAVIAPAAQAEPMGSYERQSQSSVEIPYLSHGVGVSHMDFDQASPASAKVSTEIPYLSHGNLAAPTDFWNYDAATGEKIANTSPGISADQLAGLYSGDETAIAPDDMTLSRPSNVGSPSVTATDSGWDVGPTTVSVFALGFVLLAGASLLAIRHNRRTRLSPA
jgi:hypothetical protein